MARDVRKRLLDPDYLKAYVIDLPEAKRAILDRVLATDAITQDEILRDMGEGGLRALDEMIWKTPLFFHTTDRLVTDTPLQLASDLKPVIQALDGRIEDMVEAVVASNGPNPSRTREQTSCLVPDLCTLLGFIEQRRPRALKHGGVSRPGSGRSVNTTADTRNRGTPNSCSCLRNPPASSVATREHGGLRKTPPTGFPRAHDIRNAVLRLWRETDRWNEWTTERSGARVRNRNDTLKALRSDLLDCLARCPENSWISYPDFYGLLARRSETFAHLDGRPPSGAEPDRRRRGRTAAAHLRVGADMDGADHPGKS